MALLIGNRQPVERPVQALQDPDADIVRMAAEALAKIGDARAVDSYALPVLVPDWAPAG